MDYPKSVPGVGLVGGKFVDENPGTGQQGSLIPSAWGNSVTEELLNLIRAAGVEPNEALQNQIAQILWADPTEAKRGMPVVATKVIAEAGVDDKRMMSAEKVLQLIRATIANASEFLRGAVRICNQAEANAGVDDSTAVSPLKINAAFGLGQSLQDVTASRAAGVTYTNTSSRPIALYISASASTAGDAFIAARVGSSSTSIADACVSRAPVAPGGIAAFAIVPPGGAYNALWAGVSNVSWREMR